MDLLARKIHVTRSVRLEKEIDNAILDAAHEQGISANMLVSRILQRFVDWEIKAERFGFVEIPPDLTVYMAEFIPEEQLRELGRWFGETGIREYVLFWFKEFNFNNLTKAFPELIAKYGRALTYEHNAGDGRGVLIIRHNGGRKWSAFYEEVVRTAFERLIGGSVVIDNSPNSITAKYVLNGSADHR